MDLSDSDSAEISILQKGYEDGLHYLKFITQTNVIIYENELLTSLKVCNFVFVFVFILLFYDIM